MKYYLLDYENVNSSGLDGLDELSADSRIVLFYTRNSSKIDLGSVNMLRGMKGELSIIEVHHGKQALDIQLASYLGYLIGTEPKDTEYYIISKDKGYRNVQSFWPDRRIVLCRNLHPDSEIIDEPAEEKKSSSRSGSGRGRRTSSAKASNAKVSQPAKPKPAPVEEPAAPEPAAETKPAEEPETNAFAEAAAIARAVVEAKKARTEAETKKPAAKKKTAAKKASANKTAAKKAPAKKDAPKKPAAKKKVYDRNDVNNEIQKTLSKEGYAEDVVNATASLVAKNYGKDGYLQVIYRGIIKENGQKQGLAIYRLIKDQL